MAFKRTADAVVKNPSLNLRTWDKFRDRVDQVGGESLFNKTASSNLSHYSPDKYLLTHCTIIASVDVDEVPNVRTGEKIVDNGGRPVKRLWNEYYITPDTTQYVNQNGDAWERQLLLNTFRTFIGAENYVEHVQIPELSKGKVIDAVARNLGDTVYVDILVATDRRHASLIADIESGKMNSLSMGCSIQYSICTKCGNVAADDTELCDHVTYYKGDSFIDHSGKKRVIAELCGHKSDPESVTFIEASWVANPAFKGAVLRSILNPTVEVEAFQDKAAAGAYQILFDQSPMLQEFITAQNIDKYLRTASDRSQYFNALQHEMKRVVASATPHIAFNFGDDDEGDGEEDENKNFVEETKKEVKEEVVNDLKKKVKQDIKDEMGLGDPKPEFNGPGEQESLNDTIVKSYQAFASRYASELGDTDRLRKVFLVVQDAKRHGWGKVKSSTSYGNVEILAALRLKHRDFTAQSEIPNSVYPCLRKVGGTQNYNNVQAFLNACELALDRKVSKVEAKNLILLGKLLK